MDDTDMSTLLNLKAIADRNVNEEFHAENQEAGGCR
jgi:hypothetical protein